MSSKHLKPYSFIALFLLFVGFSFYFSYQAFAATDYYVSPNGSDSNNGSQNAPFLTIQKAANVATPGTTVHVLPGTYTNPVTINTSGTADAPITFISDTKWGAKLVTVGGLKVEPFHNNASYIHIINFDITSSTAWTGILTYGQHNLIQGNHVHNLTGMSCSGSPGGQGIGDDATASYNSVIGNMVNNIGPNYPTACDYVHGIYMDGVGDVVQNNITYNNVGNGLYYNHGNGQATFSNNTTFANAEYGIGINGNSGADNFIVSNNIIVGNGLAGMKTWSTVSGTHNQFLNNLFYNNPKNYIQDGQGTLQNTITSDPQFVNYQSNGTGDYHLQSTSPAVDSGTSVGAPDTDFDGNSRPQGAGYDIGAYEYVVAVPPTVTPTATATSTPTPIAMATPTPGSNVIAQDTFQRSNQTYWGTASDGQTWGGDANSATNFSISNNTGQVATGTGTAYNATLGSTVSNAEVLFSGSMSSFTNSNLGAAHSSWPHWHWHNTLRYWPWH